MANPGIHVVIDRVQSPRAWILLVHGLADHGGRYQHIVDHFNGNRFSVMRYDHRGHGRSDGLRGYIERFQEYVDDFASVLNDVRDEAAGMPVFVLAHSMGALVVVQYLLQSKASISGVMFTGALIKVNEEMSPLLQKMSGLISAIAPKLATVKIDNTRLTHDINMLNATLQDPLHYKGGIRARTGAEILVATRKAESALPEFTQPVLLMHGGDDQLTRPVASENMYHRCSSADKTLKIYPGAYHELLHETNRNVVMQDIYDWMLKRLS